jgi:hypothetical protein
MEKVKEVNTNEFAFINQLSIEKLIEAYNILLNIEEDQDSAVLINSLNKIINVESLTFFKIMELMYIIRTILHDKARKQKIQIIEYTDCSRIAIFMNESQLKNELNETIAKFI